MGCYYGGKVLQVLDEAFAVLNTLNNCVKRNEQPRETQELLKDIRDYSRFLLISREVFQYLQSPRIERLIIWIIVASLFQALEWSKVVSVYGHQDFKKQLQERLFSTHSDRKKN